MRDMKNRIPFLDRAASIFSRLLSLLYVPKCIICEDTKWENGELCPACLEMWEGAKRMRCPVCKKTARSCSCRPILLSADTKMGEKYLTALSFYGKADSVDERDLFVRRAVKILKTSPDRRIVTFVARELSAEILRQLIKAGEKPEAWRLCNPPGTRRRIRKYGFDQGAELVRLISGYTGIKEERVFVRTGNEVQKSLGVLGRKKNAESSLSLKDGAKVVGKKYIIADDIITTGATVNASAELLLRAGAEAVYPVCFAKTGRRKRKLRRKPAEAPWFSRVVQ